MNEAKREACPICGKPSSEKTNPFCSVRCGMIDLGRWLGEEYRLPDQGSLDENLPAESDEA